MFLRPLRLFLDLDDTLITTTKWAGAYPSEELGERMSFLEYAPGAEDFLALYGKSITLLTAGREAWQQKKIDVLRIARYVSDIVIVPTGDDKYKAMEERREEYIGHECFVIGDRLDKEIASGNQLKWFTIRMKLSSGKYSHLSPANDREKPRHEVNNFFELISFLRARAA